MWIGRKLKQLATGSSASVLPPGHDDNSIRSNQYFPRIDGLLKEPTNIVEFKTLEWLMKSTSTNPDQCTTLANVLMFKLNGYRESSRRGRKMFKTLVIVDFMILNGVSAFIDLFEEQLRVFQSVAGRESGQQHAEKQFDEIIQRKADHICRILKDKKLRVSQKEHLQRARMHLTMKNKENLYNSQQQQQPIQSPIPQNDQKGRFQRIESFVSDKLQKIAIALIGLIDEDAVLFVDAEGNKEFMERGQNIIENERPQPQAEESGGKENARNKEQPPRESSEAPKQNAQPTKVVKKPELENLLGLELQLL